MNHPSSCNPSVPPRTSRIRLRRAAWSLGLVLAVGVIPATTGEAHACRIRVEGPRPRTYSPNELVAQAEGRVKAGRSDAAMTLANRAIGHPKATAENKARAWGVVAWVRWQRGEKASAKDAAVKMRALDGAAWQRVLASAPDAQAAVEMKKALSS